MPMILYTQSEVDEKINQAVRKAFEDLERLMSEKLEGKQPDLSAVATEHHVGVKAGHRMGASDAFWEMKAMMDEITK